MVKERDAVQCNAVQLQAGDCIYSTPYMSTKKKRVCRLYHVFFLVFLATGSKRV